MRGFQVIPVAFHNEMHDRSAEEWLTLVESALDHRKFWPGFTKALEYRFEADTGPERGRFLAMTTAIGVIIVDMFEIADKFILSSIWPLTLLVTFGLITPVGVAAIVVQSRSRSPVLREGSVFLLALLTAMVIAVFNLMSGNDTIERGLFLYNFVVLLIYSPVMAHSRFAYALASTTCILVLMAMTIAGLPDLEPGLTINLWLMAGVVSLIALISAWRLEGEFRRAWLLRVRETLRGDSLSASNRRLTELTHRDPLTGLGNRRHLELALADAWQRAQRLSQPISMVMIDVDCFKPYNDRYGHPSGDQCLKALAGILRSHLRAEIDSLARYGGEEFLLLLPGLDTETGLRVAERIREAVEAAQLPHDSTIVPGGLVTVSLGVAAMVPHAGRAASDLIAAADAALYAAKEAGRNRVSSVPRRNVFQLMPTRSNREKPAANSSAD
jgi:diguanylate cyclase (GGDEF)-like protein